MKVEFTLEEVQAMLDAVIAPLVIGALLTWFSWRSVVVMNVVPGAFMAAMILISLGAFSVAKEHDANDINAKAATPFSVRQYMADVASLLRNKGLILVSFSKMGSTLTVVAPAGTTMEAASPRAAAADPSVPRKVFFIRFPPQETVGTKSSSTLLQFSLRKVKVMGYRSVKFDER